MKKTEFFIKCLSKKWLSKRQCCFDLLAISEDGHKSDFLLIEKGKFYDAETKEEITDCTLGEPVIDYDKDITIPPNVFLSWPEGGDTTIGVAILNYIAIERPFRGKVPYHNESFNIGTIENNFMPLRLMTGKEDEITKGEYMRLTRASDYLKGFANVVVHAATRKTIVPPPGIVKKRDQYIKEIEAEFGEDAFKDYTHVVTLQEKLRKDLEEYLKDDPSLGVTVSGKVKDIAMTAMYLTGGAEAGFNPNADAIFVRESLSEGLKLDPEAIVSANNTARFGSFSRGNETKYAGLMAKLILRAIFSVMISEDDCKVKLGKPTKITKENSLGYLGRHILAGGEILTLDSKNIESYFNKTVIMRSPGFCKTKNNNVCKICAGLNVSENSDGFTLSVIELTGVLLNSVMKVMHGKTLTTIDLDFAELLT